MRACVRACVCVSVCVCMLQHIHGIPVEKKGKSNRLTENKHVRHNYSYTKETSVNDKTRAKHETPSNHTVTGEF